MERIGRYDILEEIGRGAMGVVCLAHDARLQRRVALKTVSLPEGLGPGQREEFRQRFLREAQAAARLSHPNIVTVFDADTDEATEQPYIAMEYVEGATLRELFEADEPLGADRAFEIVSEVAQGLDAAHAAGIVHRDVKPANLIVRSSDGQTKVADFGVARVATSELTLSGTTLGSPAYMSPEQVRGGEVDGRSDLFSLAVILYEALCGTRPFDGSDTAALAYSIAHETPIPPTRHDPTLPAGLDSFMSRALAKDPDQRYADGAELRRALESARLQINDPDGTVVIPARPVEDAPSLGSNFSEGPPILGSDSTPLVTPVGSFSESPSPRMLRRSHWIALLLLAIAVVGWALIGGADEAYLKLDAKSSVVSGELQLLVDGEQVYQRELSAPNPKNRGLLKKVLSPKPETFEAWIEVEPGKHEVVAQIQHENEGAGYRDTVVVDLEPGQTRRLRLVAGRAFGSSLSLKVN